MTNNLQYKYQHTQEEDIPVWRRDPTSSFSDWTIKVVKSEDNTTNASHRSSLDDSDYEQRSPSTSPKNPQAPYNAEEFIYNVHKVFLASGPRKSEYFQTLFSLSTSTQESLSETTTLVLPESACGAFPRFLDFVYGPEKGGHKSSSSSLGGHHDDADEEEDVYSSLIANGSELSLSECASMDSNVVYSEKNIQEEVGLAFLADYLRVPALVEYSRERIAGLLNKTNVHIVCKEAQQVYSLDWIVDLCIKMAAQSPKDLLLASDPSAGLSRNNAHHTPSLFDAKERSSLLVPNALKTLLMLPQDKQVELLRKALSSTLQELETVRQSEEDDYHYEFRT